MREIVLDTETTGMDPSTGDRLVEIGCVELENNLPTGKTYHVYINPERPIPPEATAVHGITDEYVKDMPTFGEVVGDFMDFIGNDRLVIHNAEFDVKFINAELKKFGFPSLDIMQPSLLLGSRKGMRPLEFAATLVAPLINPLLTGSREQLRAIAADTVAAAMLGTVRRGGRGVYRHTYAAMRQLAELKPAPPMGNSPGKKAPA